MKNYRRTLALVLTVILAVCMFALPVMAATQTTDGLELTLTTDKAEYAAGEKIEATLTVKNTTQAAIENLLVKHTVPQGFDAVGGTVEDMILSLAAGESAAVTVELAGDFVPKTGDHGILAVAVVMGLSAIGLVYLGARDAKVRKSVLSVFLCCVMLGGLTVSVSAASLAEGITVSGTVKIDGHAMSVSAVVKQLDGDFGQVVIDELTNGTVTSDKKYYEIGETVTLTVSADRGYSQKLYINGEPLMLDWKNNTYTFTATEARYEIAGSFVEELSWTPADTSNVRYDLNNQGHNVINVYYPNDTSSWWADIDGEYSAFTVKAKNYLSVEDSKEGNGNTGFAVALRMTLSNGKNYAFRIFNDKGTYACDYYGAAGSATGWGGWQNIHSYASQINGEGVDFKLERTNANTLKISVNGTVIISYTMNGVTENDKVVSVGLCHYGNKGEKIELPFTLAKQDGEIAIPVTVTIPTLQNGTVTADKGSYDVGDTVTLTVTPAEGYSQKLYINGEPVMLDWKTNAYSFMATETSYTVTGSFVPGLDLVASDAGRWDSANHAHGILNAYYPVNDDAWFMDFKGEYASLTVKAKNYRSIEDSKDGVDGSVGYAVILRVTLDNGKVFAFRIYNDKGTYAYAWYGRGGSVTGWGGWKNIHSAYADAFQGDGVDFKLERISGNQLALSLNGTVVETYTMSGVTGSNKVVSMGIQHNGNKGEKVEIPFKLTTQEGELVTPVTLTLPTTQNGTVTADKGSYILGDTVTLTVSPAAGYYQKLYVNGQPLLLDWNTNTYSFVATETTYNITGSFEADVGMKPFDASGWNLSNQAHGVINTKYNASHGNESWWLDIEGEYTSFACTLKNYRPVSESYDGVSGGPFRAVIRMTFSNGKNYAFMIWVDGSQRYCYNRCDYNGSSSGSGGAWRNINEKDPAGAALFNTTGAEFKIERVSGNQLKLTVNGTEMETFTMAETGADAKVVSVGMRLYGNPDKDIRIPFKLA